MIKILELPTAGGVDYNGGDVRYPNKTDLDGLSAIVTAIRNLTYRDNVLVGTVNTLVSESNNREQIINIPIPWTQISAGGSVVVSNFRIPTGWEGRILSSSVSSSTPSAVRLEIYHQTTFGNSGPGGGQLISSTNGEVSHTTFYGGGEFIVVLVNTSTTTSVSTVASIHATLRPAGVIYSSILAPSSLTLGSSGSGGGQGASGYSGYSGLSGFRGSSGYSGPSGTAGADGLNAFTTTTATFIQVNVDSDVAVSMASTGWMNVGQIIYIQNAGHYEVKTINTAVSATLTRRYDTSGSGTTIATNQKVTPAGRKGDAGTAGGEPTYSSASVDINYEPVSGEFSGGFSRSLVTSSFTMPSVGADTSSLNIDDTTWFSVGDTLLLTSAGWFKVTSKTSSTVVLKNLGYPENIAPAASFTAGPSTYLQTGYTQMPVSSGTFTANELKISNGSSELAVLNTCVRINFAGKLRLTLPNPWTINDVSLNATSDGGSASDLQPRKRVVDSQYFEVEVPGSVPLNVTLTLTGIRLVP